MDWWQVIVALVVLGAGAALILWMRKGAGKEERTGVNHDAVKVEPKVGPLDTPAPRPRNLPPEEAAPKPAEAAPAAPAVQKPAEPPKPAQPQNAEIKPEETAPAAKAEAAPAPEAAPKEAAGPAPEVVAPVVSTQYTEPAETEPVQESDELLQSDPIVDDVFRVTFKTPIAGMHLMKALEPLEHFSETANVCVYAFEDNQKGWFKPDSIGIFSSLAVYLQTVTSRGSLDDISINRFFQILDRLEVNNECTVEGPDVQDVIAKTRHLARIAQEFGASISLLIHAYSAPITPESFERVAGELGFKRRSGTEYEKVGELVLDRSGKRLGNRRGILKATYIDERDVMLSLAAGLTQPDREPLREFICAANAFAAHWDAVIVNGSGAEINNSILCTVRRELQSFYESMRMGGIEPGSVTAHRLLD
jgi:hypothetical protein